MTDTRADGGVRGFQNSGAADLELAGTDADAEAETAEAAAGWEWRTDLSGRRMERVVLDGKSTREESRDPFSRIPADPPMIGPRRSRPPVAFADRSRDANDAAPVRGADEPQDNAREPVGLGRGEPDYRRASGNPGGLAKPEGVEESDAQTGQAQDEAGEGKASRLAAKITKVAAGSRMRALRDGDDPLIKALGIMNASRRSQPAAMTDRYASYFDRPGVFAAPASEAGLMDDLKLDRLVAAMAALQSGDGVGAAAPSKLGAIDAATISLAASL